MRPKLEKESREWNETYQYLEFRRQKQLNTTVETWKILNL